MTTSKDFAVSIGSSNGPPSYPHTELPAYDSTAVKSTQAKSFATSDDKKHYLLDVDHKNDTTIDCSNGHDTRLSKPCAIGIAASLPWSLIYLHSKKTRQCRKCGEQVPKVGCCVFS